MIMNCSNAPNMSKKDDEIRWDASPACRWRKYYAGKTYRVSASELLKEAGINADRTDPKNTKHLAKQWFQKLKEEIDAKIALQKFMPNQADYLLHRESMQRDLIGLAAIGNPEHKSLVDKIKKNIAKIDQILSRAETTERILSPLPLSLHNPLALPEKVVEAEAERDTIDHVIAELQEEYAQIVALGELEQFGYYDCDNYVNDEEGFQEEFTVFFEDGLKGDDLADPEKRRQFIIETVEKRNLEFIRKKAEKIFRQRRLDVENSKKKFDLLEDFRRGQIVAEIGSKNIPNKEEFRLHYQIGRFIESEYKRHKRGEIVESTFSKLNQCIKVFKEWTNDRHVRELEGKEMPLEYHSFLCNQIQKHVETDGAEGINDRTAKDHIYFFKRFVFWLQEREIIGNISRVYSSKTALSISVAPSEPNPIPIQDVLKIYNAASDRMKLCILLMLNCGYGAAEIGSLKRSEVDFVSGRISRKRSKTKKHKTTPVVSYKLWGRTLDLLIKEHEKSVNTLQRNWGLKQQSHDYNKIKELVLLNSNCTPLCHNFINPETKTNQRTDCVRNDWYRLLIRLGMVKESTKRYRTNGKTIEKKKTTPLYSFYQLRSTAATLLGNSKSISNPDEKYNHKDYSLDTFLFLGHAPKTTAEKHYVQMGENRIDDPLEWLEQQFFPQPQGKE